MQNKERQDRSSSCSSSFGRSELGATIVEKAVLIALICVVSISSVTSFGLRAAESFLLTANSYPTETASEQFGGGTVAGPPPMEGS